MNAGHSIAVERIAMLMPMHLLIGADGAILSCGPTLRKMIGQGRRAETVFELRRAPADARFMPTLCRAAQRGERVFLGIRDSSLPPLRGEAAPLPAGNILIDLSFGIGVIEAIATYDLTDADFAASDLAIEIMYLHKSNQAIRAELERHSLRLDEAREAAEVQAFTDPLTGLLNRRGFELAFSRAIEARTAPGGKRQEFALLQLDLDWFKDVNDRFGHAAGDAVLCRTAAILRQETRADDSLARIGGDEFLILLPGRATESALLHLGRRIVAAIRQPVEVGQDRCRVSASVGGTLSDRYDIVTPERMLADCDAALYAAKRDGRGCMRLHGTPVMQRR